MGIETEIVIVSILAMVGIIGMPAYVFWWFWRKSGQAQREKEQHSH